MPILEAPGHCLACGANMDIWCDHALVCSCGGDRTIRHNAIRDATHQFARAAGLNPVKEKPGLLGQRPGTENIREAISANGRRPADVWIPHLAEGGPAALDFAVTSGMRSDLLFQSALDTAGILPMYEEHKRTYLGTEAQCNAQGLQFFPMVIEAHSGSWGQTAKKVGKMLVEAASHCRGITKSAAAVELAQRISTTLHRENARAVLRKMPPNNLAPRPSANSAAWADAEAEV